MISFEEFIRADQYRNNIFDNDGLFPDWNDIADDETPESLADLLILAYITNHGLVPEKTLREKLIDRLERDWHHLDS